MVIFTGLVKFLHKRKNPLVHEVSPHDEYGHVSNRCNNACVRNDIDWRTVKEDIFIFTTQLLDHVLEPVCKKKLSRIRRKRTYREEREILAYLLDMVTIIICLAIKVRRNTCMIESERITQCCLSKVKVDKYHLRTLKCHTCGKVHHSKRLTCIRVERSEHEHMRLVALVDHQVDICS